MGGAELLPAGERGMKFPMGVMLALGWVSASRVGRCPKWRQDGLEVQGLLRG